MWRKFVGVLVLVVCMAGFLVAAEYKGKVKSVDTDKNTITVTVGDDDKTFIVADDTKITGRKGAVKNGLKNEKAFKTGNSVTIITEKKDDKEVVTEIKVTGGGKKKQ